MENEGGRFWYIFYDDILLLQKRPDGGYTIPFGKEAPVRVASVLPVVMPDGVEVLSASVEKPLAETEQFMPVGLRASFDYLERHFYDRAGKAYELLYWDKHSRYCPVCGTPTEQCGPIMKRCLHCGNEIFPSVSPAILVLVRKEDAVLLVHARNFKGSFHGLVAGFLETGETLEECAEREVREETGLSIRNITYFANQPWPYPSNLMIGFMADYAGGEIKLQEEELSTAAFFPRDRLPELPQKLSLARRMIDAWLAEK